MLRARTGWARARQSRVWAAMAAAALAVGCSWGGGTAGTGRGALGQVSGLGLLGLGRGWEQGTNTRATTGAEAGHGKGVEGAEAQGKGWAMEGM